MEFTSYKDKEDNRIVSTKEIEGEEQVEVTLRPRTMQEYVGQKKVKENLDVYITAAKKRKEATHVRL